MFASRIVLAVSLMLAAPCAALAQDELVSANARAKLPTQAELAASTDSTTTTAKPLTTDEQIIAWLNHAPRTNRDSRENPLWPETDGDGKRKVHGGAGVSIGTGGYRSGYVYTLIPVGDNGMLGLSYSQTDYGDNPGWGYYDRYDGYPGYYGHGRRGGTSQSFGLSLDMTGSRGDASDTPQGCAPSILRSVGSTCFDASQP